MADVRVGGAYVDLIARSARFVLGVKQSTEALKRQQRALRDLGRDVRTFNREARVLVRRFAAIAGIGLVAAVTSFARFGETMAQVRGVSQATGEQFTILRQQALDLGRDTRFSTTQAAEGQLFLARAGFAVRQIYAALPSTLLLAQAATISVGQAADFVSNALAAFGKDADETSRFVDVLAKTTTSANTDMLQLADALKLVAPVATALGVGVETTAAAIGVLSDAGLQATLAGTGLRKVMFDLQSPTAKVRGILKDLGLTMRDVSVEQHGLIAAIQTLRDAGISATQVIEVFGARGSPAFLNLSRNLPRFEELTQALRDSAGAAKELARIQDDTLGGAFRRAISAAEGFGIALTETSGLGTSLQSALDGLADSINKVTDNLAQNIDRIIHIGELLVAVFIVRSRLGVAIVGITASLGKLAFSLTSVRVAATAVGVALRGVFLAFRPFLIIEGVIQLIKLLLNLRQTVRDVGTTFANVALVAGIDFVTIIANALVHLPVVMYNILVEIEEIMITGLKRILAASLEAFLTIAGINMFTTSLSNALTTALEEIQATLLKERDLFGAKYFDFTALLGFDPDELRRAREALATAAAKTRDEFLSAFGFGDAPSIPSLDLPAFDPTVSGAEELVKQGRGILDLNERLRQGAVDAAIAFENFAANAILDLGNITGAVNNLTSALGSLARTLLSDIIKSGARSALASVLPQSIASRLQPPTAAAGVAAPASKLAPLSGGNVVTLNFSPNVAAGIDEARVNQALAASYPAFRDALTNDIMRTLQRRRA